MAKPVIEIIDCASDNQNSYTITPPADTWMTKIGVLGVGHSGADLIYMEFDSVSTGYIRSFHATNADAVDTSRPLITSFTGTVHSGHTTLIGLNLVCPTYYYNRHIDIGDITEAVDGGWLTNVTAHTTFRLFTNGGAVMNVGFFYITHYIRKKREVIETVDFSASPASSHDFDVKKNNSLVLLCPDLTIASADEPRLRVSTDGIIFDSGASDYEVGSANQGGQSAETRDVLYATRASQTGNSFFAHIENFWTIGPTSLINAAIMETSFAAPAHSTGLRLAGEKNTHLRLFTIGGANFNGGTAYLIGAK